MESVPQYQVGLHSGSGSIARALLLGMALALAIYGFWITCTMGNLPRESFPAIVRQGGDIAALMTALREHLQVNALSLLMSVFSHFAVICSFLGVTAGLFDFIADRLQWGNSPIARCKTACMAFLPPLSASLWKPDGFVAAIGFAGLFATLWAVIVPALLARKAQRRFPELQSRSLTIGIVLAFGALNIVAWLMNWFNLLPEFVSSRSL